MKKSIMPPDELWSTEPFGGAHKHHVFGGANRKLSEEDGLFIYLTPEMHNMSAHSVGEFAWLEHYHKTKEDFIKRYGRNYI